MCMYGFMLKLAREFWERGDRRADFMMILYIHTRKLVLAILLTRLIFSFLIDFI